MSSDTSNEQTSRTAELGLVLATVMLTGASLLGPASLQSILSQFGVFLWGAILILTYVIFRGKGELGLLLLIQAVSVVSGIGLLLVDAIGIPFGFFGGFIWAAVLLTAFVFGIIYFAQFVLPLTGNEGWSEGVRLLYRHFSDPLPPAPATKAKKKRRRSSADTQEKRKDELPRSFKRLSAGTLHSYQALAMSKGSGFSRPAGPGFVMVYGGEKTAGLVDVRPHARAVPVRSNTRDGIPVETTLHLTFRVRQTPPEQAHPLTPHPYDGDAIFEACYANSIGEDDELRSWKERLDPLAEAMMAAEINRFTLNDFYEGDDNGLPVIQSVRERLQRKLNEAVAGSGVEVLSIHLDRFEIPERVANQRIKTWQADWQRKITMQQATGDAEVLRRIKRARADAQFEIIQNITQNIEAMRQSGEAELSEIIMLRMIEALEKAMSDETVQVMIPREIMTQLIMDSSEKLQAWTARPSEAETP